MIGFGDIVRVKRDGKWNGVVGIVTAVFDNECCVEIEKYMEYFCINDLELVRKYNSEEGGAYDKGFENCFNMLKHIYSLNQPELLHATGRTSIADVLNSDIYDIQTKYKKWVEEREIRPGHVVIHDGIKFLVTYVDKCSDSIEGITLADGRIIKLYKKNVTKAHGINRSEELKDLISKIKEDL